MKKTKVFIAIIISIFMLFGYIPVRAVDFNVEYKSQQLPLITDEYGKLAYQLNADSSKYATYYSDIKNTSLTTSYYIFGKNNRGNWINTVYGGSQKLKNSEETKFLIGWNTGIIYNDKDYIVATDVNNYRNTVSIADKVEENTGLVVKTEFIFRNEGQLLEVLYHVKNNSSSTKNFLLWSGGDTELATDDTCVVGLLNREKARGFYLYSADATEETYLDALNTQLPIFATDDDVKFWYSDDWDEMKYIYDETATLAEDAPKSMTALLSKPGLVIDRSDPDHAEIDTAAVWYWDNQSLDAGEEKVYSILVGITNFTEDIEDNIASIIGDANQEIEDETYTVSFDLSDIKGGGSIPSQTIESRGKATKPEEPIHNGNMIFDDWYIDNTYTTKFDFENTIITADTTIYGKWKLPPGEIKITDLTGNSDFDIEILTPVDDVVDAITLTETELASIEAGKNISIYVEVKDASDDLSDEAKAALEDKLGDKTEIGTYLDIGLFKKVDGEEPTRIPKSKEPLKISLEIPEDLKNTDSNIKRTYKLIKLVDDELTEIEIEVKDGRLVFETDDFSTYALTYEDKKVNSLVPNTLDGVIIYAVIFTLSIMIIKFIGIKIKRLRSVN